MKLEVLPESPPLLFRTVVRGYPTPLAVWESAWLGIAA